MLAYSLRMFKRKNILIKCIFLLIMFICVFYFFANNDMTTREREEEINALLMTQNTKNAYRINTTSCKISKLPLFDVETIKLFRHIPNTIWKCGRKPIVTINRVNDTWIQLRCDRYKPVCYYSKLSRGIDDNYFIYGPINERINLPDYHFVNIVCYDFPKPGITEKNFTFNSTDPHIIHNEIIPLIPVIDKTSDSNAPNVLLVAIDATSYLNFRRNFIRTEGLLNEHNFFELRGYNKVGTNTFPNMIPFFTGHHSQELTPDNILHRTYFDDLPFIWKKYSQKGFITAFVEEMAWAGLFNFNMHGFYEQPTDYHLRPFDIQIMKQKYNNFCYINTTETQHILNWTYDFVRAMDRRQKKYFAYISISEMSHDWIEAGHYLDIPFHQFFTKLFDGNLLKNTLLIFFSDHGFRYGRLRRTHTGEVENRLPFNYIHLPEKFDTKYAENLRQNQYRLTTPFDIHASLTHLIRGEADYSLPHGLSLFDAVISESRNCNTSSIPEMFCSCYEDIEIKGFNPFKQNENSAKIVDRINSFTASVRSKCAKYVFHSIHKLYERSISRTDSEYHLGGSRIFIVQLYVNPGMALFEALLRSFNHGLRYDIIGEITRINLYGNQPHCINHKILNNYCFCRDLL